VTDLKDLLVCQLRDQVFVPGDKFPSARAIAASHDISYQTAHRLLAELCSEGHVERRLGSGTYVPGGPEAIGKPVRDVALIMSQRARRPNSFGARLLAGLAEQLRRAGIVWQLQWAEALINPASALDNECFPVIWESPQALDLCRRTSRQALLLNEKPDPGLDATLIDSVSMDDYFGGCCAADLLLRTLSGAPDFAVVAGPDDARSNDRLAGFVSRFPRAAVVPAGGWYVEHGLAVAKDALRAGPAGIFCVNDRLAEAILTYARDHGSRRPRIVGFDNAPVAAALNLTTIAIPWGEMTADAVHAIERRINHDTSAARRRLITPQPVIRYL
jgi:DNA-binding LacI/PurR family transcriptional regulator